MGDHAGILDAAVPLLLFVPPPVRVDVRALFACLCCRHHRRCRRSCSRCRRCCCRHRSDPRQPSAYSLHGTQLSAASRQQPAASRQPLALSSANVHSTTHAPVHPHIGASVASRAPRPRAAPLYSVYLFTCRPLFMSRPVALPAPVHVPPPSAPLLPPSVARFRVSGSSLYGYHVAG